MKIILKKIDLILITWTLVYQKEAFMTESLSTNITSWILLFYKFQNSLLAILART